MNSTRNIALVAGVFFIIAFVASVPCPFVLYINILHDPRYIVTGSGDVGVSLGAFLEVITAIAVIGTAVTLYPIVRRQHEGIAASTEGVPRCSGCNLRLPKPRVTPR